ncbi:hypothetical protein BDZ90DRAFT_69114 [Jaminaea rosea]|uniref:Uncharacterized protein n=1 Tax=Jaminaea rosea TaxID=1569628 RepID=A0A316UK00_9BASI|nr:hypothetical protein BDZ90DRAFT_69114 [Jaminaea rosea]PWN25596.1 hypothetical protein BDZ90DRAFT_69114 [Jaminaea rosea]
MSSSQLLLPHHRSCSYSIIEDDLHNQRYCYARLEHYCQASHVLPLFASRQLARLGPFALRLGSCVTKQSLARKAWAAPCGQPARASKDSACGSDNPLVSSIHTRSPFSPSWTSEWRRTAKVGEENGRLRRLCHSQTSYSMRGWTPVVITGVLVMRTPTLGRCIDDTSSNDSLLRSCQECANMSIIDDERCCWPQLASVTGSPPRTACLVRRASPPAPRPGMWMCAEAE